MVTAITSTNMGTGTYEYKHTPAVDVQAVDVKVDTSSLSSDIRSLNRLASNVQDKVSDNTSKTEEQRVSRLVDKCTDLLTRASNTASEGQRSYIESEVEYLKQNINFVNMAL